MSDDVVDGVKMWAISKAIEVLEWDGVLADVDAAFEFADKLEQYVTVTEETEKGSVTQLHTVQ